MTTAPDYLNPNLPTDTKSFRIPVVKATPESLEGYGKLIDAADEIQIEIVRWPSQGWRPVDTDSGDEGGTKQGTFTAEWRGDVLYGRNNAVGGDYILGYAVHPAEAVESHQRTPEKLYLWHANYHPDGGQLFFPQEKAPFVVPLAKPGDDVRPENFVCFWFDGTKGLYIHPNIWHEGALAIQGKQSFYDKQGAVHARVSVDFAREFNCLLEMRLTSYPPQADCD